MKAGTYLSKYPYTFNESWQVRTSHAQICLR